MSTPHIVRLRRIGLGVAHLAGACDFYESALGFRQLGFERREGQAFADLTGVPDAQAEVAALELGDQTIELCAFTPPGLPYPPLRSAADPWFQHFAIVTADMGAAYAGLGDGAVAISHGGPRELPPATGSVTAYKFRDPEGHPLELSFFAPDAVPPAWRDSLAGPVFLGIDHSAVAVADPELSTAFYVDQLGLARASRQVSAGAAQARLDGLEGAEVDIVSLTFPGGGPHLELLAYRHPRPGLRTSDPGPNDIAATRLILETDRLTDLVARLQASGTRFVSKGIVTLAHGVRAALIRDPDGHLLELHDSPIAF